MENNKLKKLDVTWIALCLGDLPIDVSDDLVLPDVMGYGTTKNEYIVGIDQFKQLLKEGIEQRKLLKNFKYQIKPVFIKSLGEGNTVLIVNEILLSYLLDGNEKTLDLRLSTVYTRKESTWKVTHWHGSLGMDEEDGTWHQEEWQRENEKLQQKVDEQTEDLKKSIEDLKATQAQLIQSEKMASLGELTAGIAHEIQNPLNFVNNFSELNKELIEEANEELEKGDIEEAKIILKDLGENLEKINHHGKRAESIVKGMLQHSRSGDNNKEPTDINKLADEYLRLAYHGMRAKNKSFNANLETDFDHDICIINIIPQDVGRVILNLLTNGFYATQQKQKEAGSDYKPTIRLKTKKLKDSISMEISDNGNGIPTAIKEKIFQPFFTTKPTGEGTGLGLSMSYDIITKGHGGDLIVDTIEGQGTTFCILIPNN